MDQFDRSLRRRSPVRDQNERTFSEVFPLICMQVGSPKKWSLGWSNAGNELVEWVGVAASLAFELAPCCIRSIYHYCERVDILSGRRMFLLLNDTCTYMQFDFLSSSLGIWLYNQTPGKGKLDNEGPWWWTLLSWWHATCIKWNDTYTWIHICAHTLYRLQLVRHPVSDCYYWYDSVYG
jgi:hypothetical protein